MLRYFKSNNQTDSYCQMKQEKKEGALAVMKEEVKCGFLEWPNKKIE